MFIYYTKIKINHDSNWKKNHNREKATMSVEKGHPMSWNPEKATMSSAHNFMNLGKQTKAQLMMT